MLPPPHKFQTRIARHSDKFFRGGEEGNGSAGLHHEWLARDLRRGHPAKHPEPGSETMRAIEVGERFAAAAELRRGVHWLGKENLADENASAGFGDAIHLAQAGGNFIAWNHGQHIIANHDGSAGVRNRQLIGKALKNLDASSAHQSHLLLGGQQAERTMHTQLLGHLQQRAVAASDVHKIIGGPQLHDLGNSLVNDPCDFLLVTATQGEVMQVAGVLGRFAAVFDVIVRAGEHRKEFYMSGLAQKRYLDAEAGDDRSEGLLTLFAGAALKTRMKASNMGFELG